MTQLHSSSDPFLGKTVQGYTLKERLGEGGMGIVYRATGEKTPDLVAIKILKPAYIQNPQMLSRFSQEALAVNQIRHPNIVEILSLGTLKDGTPYIVMEYLHGRDLAAYLAKEAPLLPKEAIRIVCEVAKALETMHLAGMIHRDLKPENIFLCSNELHVKVLDFGIAKFSRTPNMQESAQTDTGIIIGTPYYMSPEQASGKAIAPQTDIYSLGIIFYEMLLGRVPFRSPDGPLQILMQHINDPPPSLRAQDPKISFFLEQIVFYCLEKNWQNRYRSMQEFFVDLECILEGNAPKYAPARISKAKNLTPKTRKTALLPGLLILFLFLLLLGASLYAFGFFSKNAPGSVRQKNTVQLTKDHQISLPTTKSPSLISSQSTSLAQTVRVRLETIPSGALISMEGNQQELKTPTEIFLPKQNRTIRFSFLLKDYHEEEIPVSLQENTEISLTLTPIHTRNPSKQKSPQTLPKNTLEETPKKIVPEENPEKTPPEDKPPPDQLDPYETQKRKNN